MRIHVSVFVVFSMLTVSGSLIAQAAPAVQAPQPTRPAVDGWSGKELPLGDAAKSDPAPKRDLTGTWNPAGGASAGIQAFGAMAMPDDGKPEHDLPYTKEGREAFLAHHPGFGTRMVPPSQIDDPVNSCDPQGMPRQDLYEMRSTQILQTPNRVVLLYEYNKIWRVIWTDGRELPKNPEPQWYGYSVGKWIDDYTFVVTTTGVDGRTWVDNAGRSHSDETTIEETFHRVNKDKLELSVKITDPVYYTKPWVAMDKFNLRRAPDDFHVREMVCSPSEYQTYLKLFAPDAQ
jgi:hypothetical protein